MELILGQGKQKSVSNCGKFETTELEIVDGKYY